MLCVHLNQIPSLPLCDANGFQVNAILGWFSQSGQASPSRCLKQTEGITSLVFYKTGLKGWRKKGKRRGQSQGWGTRGLCSPTHTTLWLPSGPAA